MADWYGTARTNYFRVKDVDAFKEAFKGIDVEVIETEGAFLNDGREPGMVGLIGDDQYGGFPTEQWDDSFEDVVEIDVVEMVAEHLAEGEVAVFMTVGAEKHRYVTGRAVAVNSKGETRTVDLDDIYKLAEGLGPNVTGATW